MLSRVDGRTTAADIAMMTGLGDGVLPVLQRLAELGAVAGVAGPAPAARTPAPAAPSQAAPPRIAAPSPPGRTAAPPPQPRTAAPPPNGPPGTPSEGKLEVAWAGLQVPDGGYTQEELDQDADLEIDKKRRILSVFHALARLDHYQILGVDRAADKKAVKAAYFKLAAEFHPDKHFRKNLGQFKPKMEAIFKRLTQAEEVLSRKETRAEYDATLEVRAQSLAELELFSREDFDATVRGASAPPAAAPPPPPAPTPPRAQSPAPVVGASPPPRATSPAPGVAPPPPPRRASSATMTAAAPPPPRRTGDVTVATMPPPDELGPATVRGEARRTALMSKLSSGRFAAARPVPRPDEGPPESLAPKEAADSLRRMAAAKQAADHKSQVERYVEVAEGAAERGDAVAAANSYRFAAALDPTPELVGLSRKWSAQAAVVLADGYLRQGESAAADGNWADAARALLRAAAGMPGDARVLALTANALLQSEGDLHQAADLGRRAAELAPHNLDVRLTLAEVYVAANLKLSARRELEAAAKIAPDNAKVRALLKQVG